MDVRSLTLRSRSTRKRPQISAPRPIQDPNSPQPQPPSQSQSQSQSQPIPASRQELPPAVSHAPGPRVQQDGGQTSDLVKRRYSTRFNQLPNFNEAAPPVPSLPGGHSDLSNERIAVGRDAAAPLKVDIKALKDPKLPVENYVTSLLANASEQDIRDYQSSLKKLQHRTSTDLQQNVYRNRTQFIKISKDAEKLKEEMNTLRGLMSELTSALGQASATSANAGIEETTFSSRRNPNRSSVANLETMWNVQLQTLWKTVERSQKFLPVVPGRHIVLESGHWVELDSATWKPKRPVHIVLLNDHLLIAAKKRKKVDTNNPQARASAPTKLVAEECWPLQDIDMIDLGAVGQDSSESVDDPAIPNAVNVRYGQRSFTYRHDTRSSTAKNDLVMTFRRTLEELRKKLRSEAEAAAKSAEAANGSAAARRKSEFLDMMTSRDRQDVLVDVDGRQQNMRWVEGQVDDLDMDIAQQHFENAVSRIELLRHLAKQLKNNLTAQEVIVSKVDERAETLGELLLRSLIETHSFLRASKEKIGWLARLGFDDQAREAFLRARSEVITKRARQCIFEGDLFVYIFQISFVYFTLLRNTINTYQQSFPPSMSSAVIKWSKHHLDNFNSVLSRQLSSVDHDSEVWSKCMEIVSEHVGMLADVGVDFAGMVGVDGFYLNDNGSGNGNGNGNGHGHGHGRGYSGGVERMPVGSL